MSFNMPSQSCASHLCVETLDLVYAVGYYYHHVSHMCPPYTPPHIPPYNPNDPACPTPPSSLHQAFCMSSHIDAGVLFAGTNTCSWCVWRQSVNMNQHDGKIIHTYLNLFICRPLPLAGYGLMRIRHTCELSSWTHFTLNDYFSVHQIIINKHNLTTTEHRMTSKNPANKN